jgi:membrane glycosyltransferase
MTLPPRLPAEVSIEMPTQRFDGPPPPIRPVDPLEGRESSTGDVFARRVILMLLTLVLALAASTALKESLLSDGFGVGDAVLLTLFFPLFALIAFGFVNTAIGFLTLVTGMHPGFVPTPRWADPIKGRTAILMPVHNEDVDEVYGRLADMGEALSRAGASHSFDIFILSDSAEAAEEDEVAAWETLSRRLDCALYYRRRTENIGRKPGNIADWIRRFGGAYDYMLILDADSLMGGETIVGMAQIMDRRPAVALLQTVPVVIAAHTLFQRWMQYNALLYGPASTAGLVWWSGSEATFWGHNALVRVAAFAESCGLPDLPGKPPFGGTIMSHDVLEAALLRRRGWRVHMVMTEDTFEEYPPTLIDAAVRDRRWAQGNLQHLQLLGSSGFHWINRLQLLLGAMGYLASPLWLLLIATSVIVALRGEMGLMAGSGSGDVLILTLVLLFGPKLLGVIHAFTDAERCRMLGGRGAILRSVAVDVPLSILAAPTIALTQTIDLIAVVRRKRLGWDAQNRRSDGLALAEVLPRYRLHVGLGILLLLLSPLIPMTAIWLSPITLGWLLAPWLVQLTASERIGLRGAVNGVFGAKDRSDTVRGLGALRESEA